MQTATSFDEDLKKVYNELPTKEGVASRAKTMELSYDDFKEVNYLQDLLVDKGTKDPKCSIQEFPFDETEFPLMKIGDKTFEPYNPPSVDIGSAYIPRFSVYFDLFASPRDKTSNQPKWTLESTLQHVHGSSQASSSSITMTMTVVSSKNPTRPCSTLDADIVPASLSSDVSSESYLLNNAKTYKTSGNGIPNALAVTQDVVIIGMSKSQLLFFPNHTHSASSIFAPLTPSPLDSPTDAPIVYGSPDNGSDLGSVLSLSTDAAGSVCAVGYSSGNIDVISIERHVLIRSLSSVHNTAVVFVRVLSNESVLSADYDGNVNITSYTRKLFTASTNTTRIFQASQFGQIFDVSIIPFSVTVRSLQKDLISGLEGSAENREGVSSVDLVAITHDTATLLLAIDQSEPRILFTLPRSYVEIANNAPHFDGKANYVQSNVSTAWYRGEHNSFKFLRCDDELVELWDITVAVFSCYHLDQVRRDQSCYLPNRTDRFLSYGRSCKFMCSAFRIDGILDVCRWKSDLNRSVCQPNLV